MCVVGFVAQFEQLFFLKALGASHFVNLIKIAFDPKYYQTQLSLFHNALNLYLTLGVLDRQQLAERSEVEPTRLQELQS